MRISFLLCFLSSVLLLVVLQPNHSQAYTNPESYNTLFSLTPPRTTYTTVVLTKVTDTWNGHNGQYTFRAESPNRPPCNNVVNNRCSSLTIDSTSSEACMFRCKDQLSAQATIKSGNPFSLHAVVQWDAGSGQLFISPISKGCGGGTLGIQAQVWFGLGQPSSNQVYPCFFAGDNLSGAADGFTGKFGCGAIRAEPKNGPAIMSVTSDGTYYSIWYNGVKDITFPLSTNGYTSSFPFTVGSIPSCSASPSACSDNTNSCDAPTNAGWWAEYTLYEAVVHSQYLTDDRMRNLHCYYSSTYGISGACTTGCGNEIKEAGEACDSGAFCTSTCTCPPGYYPDGSTGCTICPAGYACPGGLSDRVQCTPGTYQNLTGQSTCSNCGPGAYSLTNTATTCLTCAPGTNSSLAVRGTVCPPCPSGTYQPNSAQSTCIPCSPGSSFSDTGRTTPCSSCLINTYQPLLGQTTCLNCPTNSGTQGALGATQITQCICADTYYFNVDSCLPCPVGNACVGGTKTLCNATQYQPEPSKTTCLACVANTTASAARTTCDCNTGYYRPNTGVLNCLICPAGSYCVANVKATCDTAITAYQDLPGQTSCKSCATANAIVSANRDACVCANGYYKSASSCSACNAGSFCVAEVSQPCPAGQVQPLTAQSSCTPCTGVLVPNSAKTECVCPDGQYMGSNGCTDCEINNRCINGISYPCDSSLYQYQPSKGQTTCLACGSHFTLLGPTNTSCICEVGYYLNGDSCNVCQSGYKCFNNQQIQCSSTEIQPSPAQGQCNSCSLNEVANSARTNCICQDGYFLLDGTCQLCTPGSKCTGGTIQLCAAQSDTQFYSDVSGATNCKICLNGTVSDSRDSCTCLDTFFKTGDKCEVCHPGFKCYSNSAYPCGSHEYQDLPGQNACKPCIANSTSTLPDRASCSCNSGFYLDTVQNTCKATAQSSSSGSASLIIGPIIAIIALLLILLIILYIRKSQKKKKINMNRMTSSSNPDLVGDISTTINLGLNELHRTGSNNSSETNIFATSTGKGGRGGKQKKDAENSDDYYSTPAGGSSVANTLYEPVGSFSNSSPLYSTAATSGDSNENYSAPSDSYSNHSALRESLTQSARKKSAVPVPDNTLYSTTADAYATTSYNNNNNNNSNKNHEYSAPRDSISNNDVYSSPNTVFTEYASTTEIGSSSLSVTGPLGDTYSVVDRSTKPTAKPAKPTSGTTTIPTTIAPSGDVYALSLNASSTTPQVDRVSKPVYAVVNKKPKESFTDA